IDTLGKAFQATTIACARCHDHKLDAVSMKDYYALLGVLRSSRQVSHTIDAPEVNVEPLRRLGELKTEIRAELAVQWLREAAGVDAERLNRLAAGLKPGKLPLEDPLSPWVALRTGEKKLAERYEKEQRERAEFNAKHFTPFGDFRTGRLNGWRAD